MMSKDSEKVTYLHHECGLNCAQSIVSVYGPRLGLDESTALKIASAFGGGIARTGQTCGLVTGALMVIGLNFNPDDPDSKGKMACLGRKFMNEFKKQNGFTQCSELLGASFGTEEGAKTLRENGTTDKVCPKLEQSAAQILERILAEQK